MASVFYRRKAVDEVCYVVGVACWLLVFVRMTLLILIDATSFPAITGFYIAPAYFLLMGGAVLFCACFLNLSRGAARTPAGSW